MTPEVLSYLTGVGIAALVGLVWRLCILTARQNGSLARVIKDLDDHRVDDRQDFRRVFEHLDKLRRKR